jgi:hypothetical protein
MTTLNAWLRLIALVAFVIGMIVGLYLGTRGADLRPLSDVPLRGDLQLDKRLGKAVAAADIGFGIPCAVYRNGPPVQTSPTRGSTVVFVCSMP